MSRPSKTCGFDWYGSRLDELGTLSDWVDRWRGQFGAPSGDLDKAVKAVIDVSWLGQAAEECAGSWTGCKQDIDWIPGLLGQLVTILDNLWSALHYVQSEAEWAAEAARKAGVQIDMGTGAPAAAVANPQGPWPPEVTSYLQVVTDFAAGIKSARDTAHTALVHLNKQVTGNTTEDVGTALTWIGIGQSAWATPADIFQGIQDRWTSIKTDPAALTADIKEADQLASKYSWLGKVPGSELLDTSLGDVSKLAEDVPILKDVPVFGAALSILMLPGDISEYEAQGQDPGTALEEALLKEGGSLVVGTVIGMGIVAGATALAAAGVPVIVVGGVVVGAVALGAVVCDGVGKTVEEVFNEDWDTDSEGTFLGVGRLGGIVNVGDRVLGDVGDDIGGAWHAATSWIP
jgi:hypothetical protein